MIHLKSEREIEIMRKAGRITATILYQVASAAQEGMTTQELDAIAEGCCKEMGVRAAFKGYHGYPGAICISVNEQVVHGIPSRGMKLKMGDIVGIDFGVVVDGYYGDSAITIPIGKIAPSAQKLIDVTRDGLQFGIEKAKVGNRLFDISHAIQDYVEKNGFSVVKEFVGHGIGKNLHEEPQVPNFGPKGKGIPLKEGMVLAIEPMVNAGRQEVRIEADGWTATTVDGSLSAHFEHTIAITENGPEILTLPH